MLNKEYRIRFWTGCATLAKKETAGGIAQRLEQGAHNALVGGSNPSAPTIAVRFPIVKYRLPFLLLLIVALTGGAYHFRDKLFVPALPKPTNTKGWIETPASNNINTDELKVSGWAIDPEGVARVEIVLDGKALPAQYGAERHDVAAANPNIQDAIASGYELSLPLSEGAHDLKVVVTDKKGDWAVIGERTIRRRNPDNRYARLLKERGEAADKFYMAFATSGVTDIEVDEQGVQHAVNRANNGIFEIKGLYGSLESDTVKVGIRVPLLYMRSTSGREADWVFDADFNPQGPRCGDGVIIAEDSLNGILHSAVKYDLPVLITLNGGVWADASCDVPDWDVNDYLEQDEKNCQWNEKNKVMADDFLKTLPGSMAAPELARTLSFNVYNQSYRHYKKRNLQAAAKRIVEFAKEHPHLFIGVTLEPDLYLNPFVEGETEKQWYDYNPNTIRQFREWLQSKGPYAGKGPQDLRAYAKKKPLTLEEVNKLSGKEFKSWDEVDPPRAFPRFPIGFWVDDGWVREWMLFRRHMVDWHYDEVSAWAEEAGIPSTQIFSAQGFQAPQGDSLPMANWLDSPVKNYDEAGVSIEGSVPSHGHLGVIIYGDSAINNIRMEGKESLFAMFRKVDPDWGIVEMNTSTYATPKKLADYEMGYRSLREMSLYGARYFSPMAWNGSNGLLADDPAFVSFTSYRNTPLEDAAQDFLVSHADIPRSALFWTFGEKSYSTDDGWESVKGSARAYKGRLRLKPEQGIAAISSPKKYNFPVGKHDLLVIGIKRAAVKSVAVKAYAGKEEFHLSPKTAVESLRHDRAGLHLPISWGKSPVEIDRVEITLEAEADENELVIRDLLFYPNKK